MARKLTIGDKPPLTGHKVSHSNRKTKRKWMSNVQKKSMFSVALGRFINTTLSTRVIRTIDLAGGLDNYLLATDAAALSAPMRRLQEVIRTQVARKAA
ncbi:MAG: 50S ribosomal protein L28 [Magnetococcales bacterium]|nr:50S ribosomal protein L28 [Magnetococcales bacterium]MBF0323418.1 50S ribosomal protein L28 [Magnetococcales bacterium]